MSMPTVPLSDATAKTVPMIECNITFWNDAPDGDPNEAQPLAPEDVRTYLGILGWQIADDGSIDFDGTHLVWVPYAFYAMVEEEGEVELSMGSWRLTCATAD